MFHLKETEPMSIQDQRGGTHVGRQKPSSPSPFQPTSTSYQVDESVVLQGGARGSCDNACAEEDALLLQQLLDAADVRVQRVQVPQLTVLLLGAADE